MARETLLNWNTFNNEKAQVWKHIFLYPLLNEISEYVYFLIQ